MKKTAPCVYYHVTERANVEAILKHGINAGSADGHIYMLSCCDLRAVASVASNQAGIEKPAIIEICASGITARVKPDRVAEAFAAWQFRVKQVKIEPEHLTFVGAVELNPEYNSTCSVFFGSNALFRKFVKVETKGVAGS